MNNPNKLSRRRFLEIAAVGTGGIFLLSQCSRPTSGYLFLTVDEARLIDAIADQIIPPDEWPGGCESGVTSFIDRQLAGPYARFQEVYRNGMKAIQENCETNYHRGFDKLSSDEQIAFLEKMEAGELNRSGQTNLEAGSDRKFFALLRDHSMQAYYGSSRHGGNRNNMSYKMLKLDYPLVIGQNRYKS